VGWLQGILGFFSFVGKLLGLIQQKKHDALVVKAASAKRAEDALAKNKKDAADAAKNEADVRALSDSELDARLRRFSRKPK